MIQQSHFWVYIQRNETIVSKRCLYFHVHGSNINNNQGIETIKCPLMHECIKKMWYKNIMEYYSALKKKEILSLATMLDETRGNYAI